MKQYNLLRNNQQSGPHSLEGLKEQQLRSTDLVWVEGSSTAWLYPYELEELEGSFDHVTEEKPASTVYVALPPKNPRRDHPVSSGSERFEMQQQEPVLETNYIQDYDDLKEPLGSPQEARSVWSRKVMPHRNMLNIAAVFIGIITSAVFMKKIVDGLVENNFAEVSAATTIQAGISPEEKISRSFQNALVTEVEGKVEKKVLPKPVKPKSLKKQVKLSASDYSTGLFGGINGLELTVANQSPHFINQVEVEVSYLKPNGEVIHKETFPVRSLRPKSNQTISIPDSKRGKKVSYKVINIYSKQYQSLLKQV